MRRYFVTAGSRVRPPLMDESGKRNKAVAVRQLARREWEMVGSPPRNKLLGRGHGSITPGLAKEVAGDWLTP